MLMLTKIVPETIKHCQLWFSDMYQFHIERSYIAKTFFFVN